LWSKHAINFEGHRSLVHSPELSPNHCSAPIATTQSKRNASQANWQHIGHSGTDAPQRGSKTIQHA